MSAVLREARAELATMLLGRRPWIPLTLALVGSGLGGLATGALLAHAAASTDLEAATVVIARGSAAQPAIAVLASLGVAAPYRDGSWMHAALAHPRPAHRLALSIGSTLVPALLLAALSSAAALAGAAALVRPSLDAALVVVSIHLGTAAAWAVWMAALAHASRSPLLVLAVGLALPLLVEPGIAGALALAGLDGVRWLLPGQALRAVSEGIVAGGTVLAPIGAAELRLAAAALVGWSAVAVLAAWARLRGGRPR
ncbi:hypothetical protein L332_05390 [Agrococcus pavilionensis RW1]|uniref:ABC-2 type transporter domain-containing protein n=1 Tax=Agrococcus pavilionensis RW1 TaxID=1330458 RepID=U1LPH7_9MICO|nr:hypothetical protein [Agrococcus pavilionensis]ERG63902.1 hypothetical protein L332_05390 [Agrococcus pavilionensis RW1]